MKQFASDEQYRINECYVYVRMALDTLESISHRNSALESVRRDMYKIEDTLHNHVGPANEEEKKWTT